MGFRSAGGGGDVSEGLGSRISNILDLLVITSPLSPFSMSCLPHHVSPSSEVSLCSRVKRKRERQGESEGECSEDSGTRTRDLPSDGRVC